MLRIRNVDLEWNQFVVQDGRGLRSAGASTVPAGSTWNCSTHIILASESLGLPATGSGSKHPVQQPLGRSVAQRRHRADHAWNVRPMALFIASLPRGADDAARPVPGWISAGRGYECHARTKFGGILCSTLQGSAVVETGGDAGRRARAPKHSAPKKSKTVDSGASPRVKPRRV